MAWLSIRSADMPLYSHVRKKGDRHRPVLIGNVEHESTGAVILGRPGVCVVQCGEYGPGVGPAGCEIVDGAAEAPWKGLRR
jgi:hypothetical protein